MRTCSAILTFFILSLVPVAHFAEREAEYSLKLSPPQVSSEKRGPSFKEAYVNIIKAAASTNNLPASLIAAIIQVESGFDPKAISSKGAIGLMQLGFSTRKAMKVSNPFDPVQNILAGARYLRELLDRFKGDVNLAVAAYNAGPEAVERHNGVPPYGQTKDFVPKVMDYYERYENGVAVD